MSPPTILSAIPKYPTGTSSAISPYNRYYLPAAFAINQAKSYMFPQRLTNRYNNSKTRTLTRRRRSNGRSTSFKQKILNTQPAFHETADSTFATALVHNNIYTVSPTQNVTQGTSNEGRVGDKIELCSLKINGLFTTAVTASAYSYRIMVVMSGEEFSATSITTSGLGPTELFLPNTNATIYPNGIINPKAVTVLHDETIEINSLIAATADWQRVAFTVPLNKSYPYQATASTHGKFKDLYIVVIGSILGGTTSVTACGSWTGSYDLIFKNP